MLDQLKQLLPPPANPLDADDFVLERNELSLNLKFPADFIQYSRIYGTGIIDVGDRTWQIYGACWPGYRTLVDEFVKCKSAYIDAGLAEDVEYRLFPAAGGLLPFGQREALYFTWKTHGDPNDWTVVVVDYFTSDGVWEYPLTFSEFLYAFVTNKCNLYTVASEAAGLARFWPEDRSVF